MVIKLSTIKDSANTYNPPDVGLMSDGFEVVIMLTDPDRNVVISKSELERAMQAL